MIKKEGPAVLSAVSADLAGGVSELVTGQNIGIVLNAQMDDGTVAAPNQIAVTYVSSDPSVAVVNNGILTAVQPGAAVITASVTMDGITKQTTFQVQVLSSALQSLTFGLEKPQLVVGQTSNTFLSGTLDDGSALNLGMYAFGLDLLPDLAYPEQANATDVHSHEWMKNVISHNTVLVDQHKMGNQEVSQPKHFDDSDRVKLMDIEAPKVYPQTELYKRTTAMIKVDDVNSYTVDFFRVKGGDEHHFSFHAAEGL